VIGEYSSSASLDPGSEKLELLLTPWVSRVVAFRGGGCPVPMCCALGSVVSRPGRSSLIVPTSLLQVRSCDLSTSGRYVHQHAVSRYTSAKYSHAWWRSSEGKLALCSRDCPSVKSATFPTSQRAESSQVIQVQHPTHSSPTRLLLATSEMAYSEPSRQIVV
jgi:hypothetical protein